MIDNNADKVSRTDCTPWRDRETLQYFYHDKGYSLLGTAEAVGCTEGTISQWCGRLNIETRDAAEARDDGTPPELKREAWLRREYLDNGRTCADLSDELGCTPLTVSRWLRRHDIQTRAANARRDRATLTCENCGDEFEVIAARSDAKYCSHQCYYIGMDMPTGRDHWSWRETPKYRPSGKSWQRTRERIRGRDGYKCRLCGTAESDMDRQLDVHHLERVRDFENPNDAVELDDDLMVALCRSCHRRVERFAPLLPEGL